MGRKVGGGSSVKIVVPASTVITQGDFYLINGFLGMAVQSIETDADGKTIKFNGYSIPAGSVPAKVTLNIESGEYETDQIDAVDTFAVGDKIYWDIINKRFTTVAKDGVFCGIVTQAKDDNNVIWLLFAPQQDIMKQAATVTAIIAADADATYGTEEATLINELKSDFNTLRTNLINAGIIAV